MHTHPRPPRGPARGFSLIELMVVVAVVAILATLATASYRSYMLRTNRTEGRIALLAIQAAQERYFLQNNQYATTMATVIAPANAGGLGVTNLTAAGLTPNGYYTISFQAATANSYTIQAVATGAQTKDTAACLTLSINEQGARLPLDSSGCWR
ncbi:MAG: prepilin-type N-terminal cleavage/methylation domain-containing protein [Proteobacteria bacterium]|nr:prepilin-type N-terminal cleavage/methylation domain-containing protein [Pseudomonadota bacterium]